MVLRWLDAALADLRAIKAYITVIRGQRVMLDADLAERPIGFTVNIEGDGK